MSSSIPSVAQSPLSSTPSASGPQSNLLSSGTGLFGNFLMFGLLNNNVANPEQQIVTSDVKSLGLETSLLTLPPELSGLSNEDLQALLLNLDKEKSGLGQKIILALTTGIPSSSPLTALNDKQSVVPINIDDLLTLSSDEILNSGNPLLSATGLTLADIDALKNVVEKILAENLIDKENFQDNITIDANEATSALILVMIGNPLPPTPVKIIETDSEFDAITFSSLTNSPLPANSESDWIENQIAKSQQRINAGGLSLNQDNPLLSNGLTQSDDEQGFQGSLSLLNESGHNHKDSKSIAGIMTTQTKGGMDILSGMSFSGLNDNMLLLPNGNALASTHAAPLANPLFTSASAVSAHPTAQAVAIMIEKAASGSEKAKQELSVQLDPPELGRLQIQLSMEKGEVMKVHLLAEKQDTLNLLQRDSHALKAALDHAGIQTDSESLSFDLASGDQSFNQLMGNSSQGEGGKSHGARFHLGADGSILNADDIQTTETKMDFITNTVTGNIHYSLLI